MAGLPDIPESDWNAWQAAQFKAATDASIAGIAAGPGYIDSSSPAAFVRGLLPIAQRWQGRTGISADTWLAMAASESNWGKAGTALFGIKGSGNAGSLNSPTWESVNGNRVNITDNFATYKSADDAFQGFWDLMQNPRYSGAVKLLRDGHGSDAFVHAINQAGYATDPNWASSIRNIANTTVQPLIIRSLQSPQPTMAPQKPAPASAWPSVTVPTQAPVTKSGSGWDQQQADAFNQATTQTDPTAGWSTVTVPPTPAAAPDFASHATSTIAKLSTSYNDMVGANSDGQPAPTLGLGPTSLGGSDQSGPGFGAPGPAPSFAASDVGTAQQPPTDNENLKDFASYATSKIASLSNPAPYNDMAGASSGPELAFGTNPQDATSPIDQARYVQGPSESPSPFTTDWPSMTAGPQPTQPLPQLLGGNQPLTDLGNQIVQGQRNRMADVVYQNTRTLGTRADQPARSQVQQSGLITRGFTPEQTQAQNEAVQNAVIGSSSAPENEAGKVIKPAIDQVAASAARWTDLGQIAQKLGIDLGEHNTILQSEKQALDWLHPAGSPEQNAALADLHNSYTASTAADLKTAVVDRLGQAQEQLAAMRDSMDPALVDAYKKYWDANRQGLRTFSVKEWQDRFRQGNRLVIPPDNILERDDRFPGQRRVKADTMLDTQAEALGYGHMNDFERALGKVGKQLNQVDVLKGQVADLSSASKRIASLQNQAKGLPDVAGGGPAASGTKIPLSDRMQQFLKESQGTPEESSRIGQKISQEGAQESAVLLKHLPENVRPYMSDVAGQYGENFAGRRRGVVHDDEAAKNAVQAAAGMSIDNLLKTSAGKAFNDSEILALGSTLNHMGQALDDLTNAKKIGVQLGRWTSQQEEKLARQALEFGVTASLFRGSQAEAGRALRAFNQVMGRDAMISVKAVGRAAERFGIKAGQDLEATRPSVAPDVGGRYVPPVAPKPGTMGGEVNPIFRGDTASGFTPDLPGTEGKPSTPNPFEQAQGYTPGLLPQKPETANPFAGATNKEGQATANLGVAKTANISHDELLKRAFAAIGTDADKFQTWVQAWQATPASDFTNRYKLLQALYQRKPKDYLNSLAYAGMLSNPATHIANGISNTLNAVLGPVERFGAAVVDAPLAAVQRRPRGRFFGESTEQAYGALRGIPEGVRAGIYALKNGFSASTAKAAKGEVVRAEAFRGPVGAVVNTPARLLTAADAFFEPILQRGALNAEIFRQASSEGLRGQALKDRIVELTANTPDSLLTKANQEAEYRLFRQPPKTVGKALGAMRGFEFAGVEPLRLVLPFVQVPINATKYGLERSPLGFLNPDLWKALAKKDPAAADSIARAGMGSLLAAAVVAEVKAGNLDITAAAPTDPAARDAFYRQGKLPFAVKIGDTWHSYQRWEPFNQSLAAVAAGLDAVRAAKAGEDPAAIAGQAGLSMAQNIVQQSFLTGINNLLNAASDPERYGGQFVAQLETSMVPYSGALRAGATLIDPRQRAPRTWQENLESITPGLSQNVPSRLNNFGEESPYAGNPLSPYRQQTANTSRLESELARLTIEPGAAGKSAHGFDLTPSEQRQYAQDSGQRMKEWIDEYVHSPDYAQDDDALRTKIIRGYIQKAREDAGYAIINSWSDAEYDRRLKQKAG